MELDEAKLELFKRGIFGVRLTNISLEAVLKLNEHNCVEFMTESAFRAFCANPDQKSDCRLKIGRKAEVAVHELFRSDERGLHFVRLKTSEFFKIIYGNTSAPVRTDLGWFSLFEVLTRNLSAKNVFLNTRLLRWLTGWDLSELSSVTEDLEDKGIVKSLVEGSRIAFKIPSKILATDRNGKFIGTTMGSINAADCYRVQHPRKRGIVGEKPCSGYRRNYFIGTLIRKLAVSYGLSASILSKHFKMPYILSENLMQAIFEQSDLTLYVVNEYSEYPEVLVPHAYKYKGSKTIKQQLGDLVLLRYAKIVERKYFRIPKVLEKLNGALLQGKVAFSPPHLKLLLDRNFAGRNYIICTEKFLLDMRSVLNMGVVCTIQLFKKLAKEVGYDVLTVKLIDKTKVKLLCCSRADKQSVISEYNMSSGKVVNDKYNSKYEKTVTAALMRHPLSIAVDNGYIIEPFMRVEFFAQLVLDYMKLIPTIYASCNRGFMLSISLSDFMKIVPYSYYLYERNPNEDELKGIINKRLSNYKMIYESEDILGPGLQRLKRRNLTLFEFFNHPNSHDTELAKLITPSVFNEIIGMVISLSLFKLKEVGGIYVFDKTDIVEFLDSGLEHRKKTPNAIFYSCKNSKRRKIIEDIFEMVGKNFWGRLKRYLIYENSKCRHFVVVRVLPLMYRVLFRYRPKMKRASRVSAATVAKLAAVIERRLVTQKYFCVSDYPEISDVEERLSLRVCVLFRRQGLGYYDREARSFFTHEYADNERKIFLRLREIGRVHRIEKERGEEVLEFIRDIEIVSVVLLGVYFPYANREFVRGFIEHCEVPINVFSVKGHVYISIHAEPPDERRETIYLS